MKCLASQRADIASRIRQGKLRSLEQGILHISFDEIFKKHKTFLESEEIQIKIEQIFEQEFEVPIKLKWFVIEKKKNDEQREDPYRENPQLQMNVKSPAVVVLQNIFKAKIRNVFEEKTESSYHLGMSANFLKE